MAVPPAFVHDSFLRCVVDAVCQPFQDFYGEREFLGRGIRRISVFHTRTPFLKFCLPCRWRMLVGSHSAFCVSSSVTGCAQGSSKPRRDASCSAFSFVCAAITVCNGSPLTLANSRSR